MNESKANNVPLNVDEAIRQLLEAVTPVAGWEMVAVRDALGRVLYRDVVAPFDVPAHDNSAMDGYVVRGEDLSGEENRLTVIGTAFAGEPFSERLDAGQAVRIMTGAMIPPGGDAVVVQEQSRQVGDRVILPKLGRPGQNIRRAGEDLALGRPALCTGKKIGPSELGLLGSLGCTEVAVRRRPRIAFFSTGNEVATIGDSLKPGQIYDSNRYTLYGILSNLGVELVDMGVVRDDLESIEAVFSEASSEVDAIITSGGVSVGEADFIKAIMARLGQVNFWKLNIKPGRPMAFGRLGEAWLFGLPGNPVAVMVNFYQIVQPAVMKLQGVDPLPERPAFWVTAAEPIRKRPGRREFPRGVLYQEAGAWRVRLSGNQGSGVLRSMVEANCFIVLDEVSEGVAAGDPVTVQPFQGLL